MLEIRVRICIRVLLLEVDVIVKFAEILGKLAEFIVEVFGELLVADLLSTAVDNQLSQVCFSTLGFQIGPLPIIGQIPVLRFNRAAILIEVDRCTVINLIDSIAHTCHQKVSSILALKARLLK